MKHVGRVSKTLPARAQQFDWKAALATPIQTPPLGYGELGDIALAENRKATTDNRRDTGTGQQSA